MRYSHLRFQSTFKTDIVCCDKFSSDENDFIHCECSHVRHVPSFGFVEIKCPMRIVFAKQLCRNDIFFQSTNGYLRKNTIAYDLLSSKNQTRKRQIY